MDMVSQVLQKVNEVFNEKQLDLLARETRFVIRKRKVEPKPFLENMLLTKLSSPKASLTDLAYEFNANNGVEVSKQALHNKFNASALSFIQAVLDKLLKVSLGKMVNLESLPFVKNIFAVDSSEIPLHKTLADVCPKVRTKGAAVKLQSLINIVNQNIASLKVRPAKEPDQKYKDHIEYIEANDLLIGDLGYFCVDTFNKIASKGGFFLSRYFRKTYVYSANTNELINLKSLLSTTREEKLDMQIKLGLSQLPCRLVAIKLPEEAYQKRLASLQKKYRKDPRMKKQDETLIRWTILVTNLPLIDADTLLQLYSLRWQIELFFKMTKTFLRLKEIKDTSEEQAMISLHIMLIAIVLLCSVVTTIIDEEISLYKASKIFVKNIRRFIECIKSREVRPIYWLKTLICKFALKESRKNRPSTQLSLGWRPLYA